MKIKEHFGNEFKKPESIVLKEKDDYYLFETEFEGKNKTKHSYFTLKNEYTNWAYITIHIPDPAKKDLYKDILLKYQNSVRKFLIEFFEVLMGEKENIKPIYRTKQKRDLYIEEHEPSNTCLIKILGDDDGFNFGNISFPEDFEGNCEVAEKIIKYFSGEEVDFSDEVMV